VSLQQAIIQEPRISFLVCWCVDVIVSCIIMLVEFKTMNKHKQRFVHEPD